MSRRLSFQHILALLTITGLADTLDIRIGHMYMYDLQAYNVGLNMTIDEITSTLLKNSTITIYSAFACSSKQTPEVAYKMRKEHEIHALLGPVCSDGMKPIAQVASAWRMPILGYMSTAGYLANKNEFQTLARISQTTEEYAHAIGELVVKMGWRRAAVVTAHFTSGSEAYLRLFRNPIEKVFLENKVAVKSISIGEETWAIDEALDKIKAEARVVVLVLGRNLDSYIDMLMTAKKRDMLTGEYVYIVVWGGRNPRGHLPWMVDGDADKLQTIKTIFQRVLVIQPASTEWTVLGPELERLEHFTVATLNKHLTDFILPHWVLRAMDALKLYGIAINACISEPDCDWTDGIQLMRHMRSTEFDGSTGRVVMSANVERLSDYVVQSLNQDAELVTRFYFKTLVQQNANGDTRIQRVLENRTAYNWRTVDGLPPLDTPECGFDGELCQAESAIDQRSLLIASGIAAAAMSIAVVLCSVRWRKKRFEAELKAMSWMLAREDVELIAAVDAAANPDVVVLEEDELSLLEQLEPIQPHVVNATCRSERVIAKRAILNGDLEPALRQRNDLLTLLAMKNMQHENVNPFIGLWMGDTSHLTFIWSSGQKGSLEDVIYNDDIQLDMVFKSSILKDIVAGLTYLHQSRLGCHGQLSAGNCIINGRWVLKLTDYGIDDLLRSFRLKNIPIHIDKPLKKLMNMAPELLRSYGYYGPEQPPTQEADIYSFGLILYQLMFCEKPYEGHPSIGSSEIIMRLKHPGNAPLRPTPSTSTEHVQKELVALIDNCLAENPSERYKLTQISTTISKCTAATSANLVEHMTGLMERYTSNLEKMVEQRTRQLLDERHRTDALLERMLPQSVAEQLKRGKSVQADVFESVSVLMSRLVDFADICTVSTPIQVVQMMNNFYSLLDGIIEQFDAYKVETVGDSYLIVSGLPQKNGNNHVTIMAEMALAFKKAITSHKVNHLPSQKLRMRIGLHTGSVAAGVVGLTLPHYCLFGDTVNMAARLESTSKAMHIQISRHTMMMLNEIAKDKYTISRRGIVDLKGRGHHETFWLSQ